MGNFRQKMNEGRRALHQEMSVPALYFAWPLQGDPLPISVRPHDHFVQIGDLAGTNFHYAEREDDSPRLIFMRSEITPKRNMIVSVEPGVAYVVDTVLPPDGITVTARCKRLLGDELADIPYPTTGA